MIWTALRPFAPWLAGAAFVAALLLYAGHLRSELKQARQAQANAEAQTKVEQAATQAVETYTSKTKDLRRKADHAASVLERAPGASDRFEPAADLCAQLERMRDGEPVCIPDSPENLP